jgi:hypothetical protein
MSIADLLNETIRVPEPLGTRRLASLARLFHPTAVASPGDQIVQQRSLSNACLAARCDQGQLIEDNKHDLPAR